MLHVILAESCTAADAVDDLLTKHTVFLTADQGVHELQQMNKRDKVAKSGSRDAGPLTHPRGFGNRLQASRTCHHGTASALAWVLLWYCRIYAA